MNWDSWCRAGVVGVALIALGHMLPVVSESRDAEIAAVITEVKAARGRAEILALGSNHWRHAQPLSALRAGGQVRATDDAAIVVLLSNGRGSITVRAATSPFVVAEPTVEPGKPRKAIELLQASFRYLSASASEGLRAVLVTRLPGIGLVVLTPRDSAVCPAGAAVSEYGLYVTYDPSSTPCP